MAKSDTFILGRIRFGGVVYNNSFKIFGWCGALRCLQQMSQS